VVFGAEEWAMIPLDLSVITPETLVENSRRQDGTRNGSKVRRRMHGPQEGVRRPGGDRSEGEDTSEQSSMGT